MCWAVAQLCAPPLASGLEKGAERIISRARNEGSGLDTPGLSLFAGRWLEAAAKFKSTRESSSLQHPALRFAFYIKYYKYTNKKMVYIFIYLYHVSILKTALPILMKPTLLTSFENEKAIGPGLDRDKTHLNWSFLN